MLKRLMLALVLSFGIAAPATPQTATNLNGTGLLTAEQAAVLQGKGWSVSTGLVSIAANKVLDIVLSNPSGNSCTPMLSLRRYSNASTSQLSFQTYSNPGSLTGATGINIGNRLIGNTTSSGLSMNYVVQNSGMMSGTAGVTVPLFATYEDDITAPTAISPGKALGLEITGLTGALSAAVTVAVTFAGFCTP